MYDGDDLRRRQGQVARRSTACPASGPTPTPSSIERKFRIYGLGTPPELQKFVCGKKLYNYDTLEPSERKLVL